MWPPAHVDKGGFLLHVFLTIRSSLVALVSERTIKARSALKDDSLSNNAILLYPHLIQLLRRRLNDKL